MTTQIVHESEGPIHTRYRSGEGLFLIVGTPVPGGDDVTIVLRGLSRAASERLQQGDTLHTLITTELPDGVALPALPDPDAPLTPAPTTVFVPSEPRAAVPADREPTESLDEATAPAE